MLLDIRFYCSTEIKIAINVDFIYKLLSLCSPQINQTKNILGQLNITKPNLNPNFKEAVRNILENFNSDMSGYFRET